MARIFSRYIWLINAIESHPNITLEELNRKWLNSCVNDTHEPLSERTFHRHRVEIWNEFGINIACQKPTNSYYLGEPDESKLTEVKRWLLKTISEENVVMEGESLGDRLQLEEIPEGGVHLQTIISAMKEKKELEMTYKSYWSEQYTTSLEPFFLKAFERRWYIIGISGRHSGELRTYALDRIVDLKITGKDFIYPKDYDAKAFYTNFFGIFHTGGKPEKVVLKASENQQNFLRSLPLHHSQQEIESGEDYAVFEYYIVPTYDFEQELLSCANTIEVLKPQWLREEMKNKIKMMLEKY